MSNNNALSIRKGDGEEPNHFTEEQLVSLENKTDIAREEWIELAGISNDIRGSEDVFTSNCERGVKWLERSPTHFSQGGVGIAYLLQNRPLAAAIIAGIFQEVYSVGSPRVLHLPFECQAVISKMNYEKAKLASSDREYRVYNTPGEEKDFIIVLMSEMTPRQLSQVFELKGGRRSMKSQWRWITTNILQTEGGNIYGGEISVKGGRYGFEKLLDLALEIHLHSDEVPNRSTDITYLSNVLKKMKADLSKLKTAKKRQAGK